MCNSSSLCKHLILDKSMQCYFTCECQEPFRFPSLCCTTTKTKVKLPSTCTASPGVNRRSRMLNVVDFPSCGERLTVTSDLSVLSCATDSENLTKGGSGCVSLRLCVCVWGGVYSRIDHGDTHVWSHTVC